MTIQKQIIGTIEREINDCKNLKRLSEETILRAKTEKDYKCVVSNMQYVLQNNYVIFRLTKLKERFETFMKTEEE